MFLIKIFLFTSTLQVGCTSKTLYINFSKACICITSKSTFHSQKLSTEFVGACFDHLVQLSPERISETFSNFIKKYLKFCF